MKKKIFQVLLLAFIVVSLTACGSKKEKMHTSGKAEDLLDYMIEGYNKRDPQYLLDVMPDFMQEKMKKYMMSKESFKAKLEEQFGDDVKVSYKITNKKKEDQDWIDEANNTLKTDYNTDKKVSECYLIEGTITFKGSKAEDTDDIEELWHCKIDNKWYLIGG